MAQPVNDKIRELPSLSDILATLRTQGKKIVHCHGVFDLVHLGHIRHLQAAKKNGDILVVTITADKFVKRGPGRPVFNHDHRAEALANLAVTDYVAIVYGATATEAIKAIRPDFYVKGSDYVDKDKDVTAKIFEEEDLVTSFGGKLVCTEELTFSSSQLLNLYVDSYPEQTAEYLRKIASKYSADKVTSMLKKLHQLKILVIGDAIIDQYVYCSPLSKSAKENIVVNKYENEELFAGGTLATANHSSQLSRDVTLVTVLGQNSSYEDFIKIKLDEHIKPNFIIQPDCVTTLKKRYVNSHDQKKLFEVCYLDDHFVKGEEEEQIVGLLKDNLSQFDLVVVNDFGHGMITKKIMNQLCGESKCLALNVQANSANMGFNFVTKFSRADFICIDELELRLATQDKHSPIHKLVERVQLVMNCKQIVVTRGANGSITYSRDDGFDETPAFAKHSVDKIGAGDAFFSYASQCFAGGFPQELIGFIGNIVGALAVQIVGNREPVKLVDVAKFAARLLKV